MLIKRLLQSLSPGPRPTPAPASPAPASHAPPIALPGYNQLVRGRHGLFVANYNDKYIGRALIDYGEFSELEWQLLERYCRPGNVVVDVGANIGAHTVTMAKSVGDSGRVVAIEPQPVVFQTLCANVALNCLQNVDAVNCGCGTRVDATFVIPPVDYAAGGNFGRVALVEATGEVHSRPVRVETLDALLQGYQRLDLVKIDVEGMEEDVLKSGAAAIARFRPVLYVENDRVTQSQSLIEALRAMGYRLWWHLPPLFNPRNFFGNAQNPWPGIGSYNMLCLPEERGHEVPAGLEAVTKSDIHPLGPDADAAAIALQAYALLTKGDAEAAARLIAPLRDARNNADVVFVQGLIELARGDTDAAVAAFRDAVGLRDDFAAAWGHLGTVLNTTGHVEDALPALERAAALEPDSAAVQQNLGYTRFRARDVGGAIAALTRAHALDPSAHETRFNLAHALLAAGDFERGWAEYEYRPDLATAMARVSLPRWTREHRGARVAVVAEQGFGDVLLFARWLPRLRKEAASVTAFVQPALVRLIAQSGLADDVRSLDEIADATSAHFDAHLPFMSMVHALGVRPGDLDPGPYLRADAADVRAWQARLGARDGTLRVGVAWAGNPAHRSDADRSIPVDRLAPLSAVPGVTLYSLQVDHEKRRASPFLDFTGALADFAQTAAFVSALDLVISVDTAVVHLAGALGAPVWVIGPRRADWRWEIGGRASPWYASARVFRPARTAAWTPVIAEVAAALAAHRTV